MKNCFLVDTGSFLPGPPIESNQIEFFLGRIEGEQDVRDRVLSMNGIRTRHYAQSSDQVPTQDVTSMATEALHRCGNLKTLSPSFLAAGTTNAPYSGPGLASLIHARWMQQTADEQMAMARPIEISSQSGICSSGAAALTAAVRAIQSGEHSNALAIGSEHSSEVLKSSAITPVDDRHLHPDDLKRSQWFMSVFLRFMLSDGAGAALVADQPLQTGLSFQVDWIHSRSFAHDTELCMKLEPRSGLLSQDVSILSRYLLPKTSDFLHDAFAAKETSIDEYDVVLPHLSSFFFRRRMEQIMKTLSASGNSPNYWTNLDTAGNTGAASMFIMLDEFRRTQKLWPGQRILLFVPESGQFNFVLISLTVVNS